MRAVLAGDVERYAVLVRRYRDRYARYAARMLGSRDVAEDAVQDALVRAFDRLADCREPHKFAGWLFLILRNRCYAERRRQQREGRRLEPGDDGVAAPEQPDGAYEQVERMGALERALGRLTPEQREVFVLKHVEGLAYEEIAGLTGATVASLDGRVMAAVRRHAASPGRRAWRWLNTPRDVELRLRVRPWVAWGCALAAAASLALLVTRATAPAPGVGAPARVAARDSVFVRFVLYAPGAQRVAVAGTFNQWDRSAAPLVRAGTGGVWTTTLALPVGQHQYAFVVDGARWVADPAAPAVDDGFGRRNSVVAVTARGARTL